MTESAIIDEVNYWIDSYRQNGNFVYLDKVNALIAVANTTSNIIFSIPHHELSDSLAIGVLKNPEEYLAAIKTAIIMRYTFEKGDIEFGRFLDSNLEIEITELKPTQQITSQNLETLVRIRGKVISIGPVHQVQRRQQYRCEICDKALQTKMCPECQKKSGKVIIKSEGLEAQRFIEISIDHEKQYNIWLDLRGSKAFFVPNFSDILDVTGIVQIAQSAEKQPIPMDTFFLYLQVVSVAVHEEEQKAKVIPQLMQERRQFIRQCIERGERPEQVLVSKIAPWIYGQDLLKQSLLYQAVSGCVENLGDRTEIHCLIMKNPSEGKSELVMAMASLTEGCYFSSEGVSAVGLVVGLEDDIRTRKKVAKAGAAILYNRKCKYMDEIDKVPNKECFTQLNTVMDKGFYTETKILNKKFETRGPWCMTGNFRNQQYDSSESLLKNINLPYSFMSRCDIWHIEPNNVYNYEKQEAKMNKQSERFTVGKKLLEIEPGLKEHILCARSITAVTFEPGVTDIIKNYFHTIKKLEEYLQSGIKITDRQFGTLWRLAIARAVLHLRDVVTKEDAQCAIEHMTAVLTDVGLDSRTGNVDLGVLSGTAKSTTNRIKAFRTVMGQLCSRYEDVKKEYVLSALISSGSFRDEQDAQLVIQEARENLILQDSSRAGYVRYIG